MKKEFLEKTTFFDGRWYKDEYGDVSILGFEPELHFSKYGALLGRVGLPEYLGEEADVYVNLLKKRQAEYTAAKELNLKVSDLIDKMRSGFESISIALLSDLVDDFERVSKKERAKAAWELARVYASLQDWPNTSNYLKKVQYLDKEFMRKKRPRLLKIESCLNTDELVKARQEIEFPLAKGIDSDFICAKINHMIISGAESSSCLSVLNSIYEEKGLSPLKLKDESKGFSFSNLACNNRKADNGEAKVSILMPVYNAEEFLDVAMTSLLDQTYRNIEIVAVDDCSSDASWSILEKYASLDTRVKAYKNENNIGAYPTRNRALHLADGDLITVHDSDDWSHSDMIAIQVDKLLSNEEIKATFTFMARVSYDLYFSLRPERNNMEYVHRSYPSLMMRRCDILSLGEWDGVLANADDEFLQRVRLVYSKEAIVDVVPEVPMSLFLKHDQSLTSAAKTSLKSLDYGVRNEYAKQAAYWRAKHTDISNFRSFKRSGGNFPFPTPNGLRPDRKNQKVEYDLVLISDLSLLGGTRRCNEAYIEAACELGLRIALFHWPRFDLKLVKDIAPEYREISFNENVDIITWEDEVECDAVIIHHPPILKYEPDLLPKIDTNSLFILVNQSPKQLYSQTPHYYNQSDVIDLCVRDFGCEPKWVSISPAAKDVLIESGFEGVEDDIWYPPLSDSFLKKVRRKNSENELISKPVVGRHARDHWTKWPESKSDLSFAYLASSSIDVKIMGGAKHPIKVLGFVPENWEIYEFDSIPVAEFLEGLDFFVHFPNEDYIEEFGRNIAEAMAFGIPVILPLSFKPIFGDAAIYCEPNQVEETVKYYSSESDLRRKQVLKGYQFLDSNLSSKSVQSRIKGILKNKQEEVLSGV